jgi:hypothetical protein
MTKSPTEVALPPANKVDVIKKEAPEDVEAIKASKKPLDLRNKDVTPCL